MLKTESNSTFWSELKSLAFIAIIALVIRTFIIEPFFIPTGSMKHTLLEHDYVFATKYNYGYSKHSFLFITPHFVKGRILGAKPNRGDIVIFKSEHDKHDKRYIKRLIGLPGDKIQMISGVLYINDEPIIREFLGPYVGENGQKYKQYSETLPNGVKYNAYYLLESEKLWENMLDNTKAFEVPEGNYFFMGDNRNESNDSRLEIGFVPYENLIAKAQFILFSTKELLWLKNGNISDQFGNFLPWLSSIRFKRLFNNVYSL